MIVVDGGSEDGTAQLAAGLCDRVLVAPRGREARGEVLVFLHADTRLPPNADNLIHGLWGRFDVHIDGSHPLLKVVAWSMNLRSRLTGIATGDQAIFVRREAFPGFPEIPLMEDVAFSKAMKRRASPVCLRAQVLTSGRRWESRGVLRTIVLMWQLRAMYAMGVSAEELARRYER